MSAKGEAWASKPTKIKCAKRGCQKRVSNIAATHGDRYCSRDCAFGKVAPRLRRDYDGGDVSDADLQEVAAGASE